MVGPVKIHIENGEMGSGRIFVDADVEGSSQRFFLDTGSPETFVHADLWPDKPVVETSPYFSASGAAASFDYIQMKEFSVGPIYRSGLQVGLILDSKKEPQKLGLNFFKDFNVTFDFPGETICHAIKESGDLQQFSFGEKGHIFLSARVGNTYVPCIFDTGAGFSAIDYSCIQQHSHLFEMVDSAGTAGDGNGKLIPCALYKVKNLGVDCADFSNSMIVGIDLASLKRVLKIEGPLMVLGFNHIVSKAWQFNFKDLKYSVR